MKNNNIGVKEEIQRPIGFLGEFSIEEFDENDLRLKLHNFLNGKDFNAKDNSQYSRPWSISDVI